MERKKRSKGSVWEFCYANKIFGTFGFEIRACGQKLVKFCTLTHIHTTAAKLVVRLRRLVKFSVMTNFDPLSLRLAVKTALRGSYVVNFTITGRGFRGVPADSDDVRPMRWQRSMQPVSNCTPREPTTCNIAPVVLSTPSLPVLSGRP